jgi:hypothetical protein
MTASTLQRHRTGESPGDHHPINRPLERFQQRVSPIDRLSLVRALGEDDATFVAGLYFFQMGNPDAAYQLGIAIAERMLPLCTAINRETSDVVSDDRPKQLLTHVKDYAATGNWASMQEAQQLASAIGNSHNELPFIPNFHAVHSLTALTDGAHGYSLTGTVWWSIRAYENDWDILQFLTWLKETFVWMMEAVQKNSSADLCARINVVLTAGYERDNTPAKKRTLFYTGKRPLLPTADEKAAFLRKEEERRQPPPAVNTTGNKHESNLRREAAMKRMAALTDERLAELAARIVPVLRNDDEDEPVLRYITVPDLRKVAFTWSPKYGEPAGGLVEMARIFTYHTYAASVFFKPTIAEVLAQIPDEHLDRVVAFETLSDGLSAANIVDDCHETVTVLYVKA